MPEPKRLLKVFLCHASTDKPKVRELYRYLRRRGINPWFDEEHLVGGQDWQVEIPKALSTSDAIIICLTKNSVDKEGYVQNEIKFALDKALGMPEGRIFLIPVKFEECEVPSTLSRYQWVDLTIESGYAKMMKALKFRASQLERSTVEVSKKEVEEGNLAIEKAPKEKSEREAIEKAAYEKTRLETEEHAKIKAANEKAEGKASEKVTPKNVPANIEDKQANILVPKVNKQESKKIKATNKDLFSIITIILVLCVSAGFIVNLFAQNIFTQQQPSTQTAQNPTTVARTAAAELTLTSAAFTATLLPTEPTINLPTKAFTSTLTPSGSLDSNCNNSMYVSDVTIPDNTVLLPNQQFVKTWRVQNTGTCTWTSSYMINNASSDKMKGKGINLSENVLPGNSVEVSVTLIAPNTPGTYQDIWQLQDDNGVYFGATFIVIIKVQ